MLTCGEYRASFPPPLESGPCAASGDLRTPLGDARRASRDSARQWEVYMCGPVGGRLLGYAPLDPVAAKVH